MEARLNEEVAGFEVIRGSRIPGRVIAAQLRADSGEKFVHAKRFGDVIVRAAVESLDLGLFLPFDGKHNDGHARSLADARTERQTIHVGHGEVRDDQLWLPCAKDIKSALAVGRNAHLETA